MLLDGLTTALGHAPGDTNATANGSGAAEALEPLYDGPQPWVTGWLGPLLVRQPTQDFL